MLVVGLPLAWLFIRQKRPEFYGLLPDGATTLVPAGETRIVDRGVSYAQEVEEIEFTLRQAIKTPAYWCLMLSIAGWQLVAQVVSLTCGIFQLGKKCPVFHIAKLFPVFHSQKMEIFWQQHRVKLYNFGMFLHFRWFPLRN